MALKIVKTHIVTGGRLVNNEDIISKFKGDMDEEKALEFLKGIGRNERYHCLENENTITLGIEAESNC